MASSLLNTNDTWKQLSFPELQRELDNTAAHIATRQDESDNSRRRLIEQSREFKKSTSEDVRKAVAPLLKCFQNEIDYLSKRSKTAEADYLTIYKKLIDLPDPCTALDQGITFYKKLQKMQDVDMENKKLRETLEEYNTEFAEVKNQEVTIKNMRDRIRDLEESQESRVSEQLRLRERELTTRYAEKERELADRQMEAARRLGEAEQKMATLQNTLESTQSELFELRIKYEDATNAKSAEADMLVGDVERANEKASALEREVESLHEKLSEVTSGSTGGNRVTSSTMERDQQQRMEDMQRQYDLEMELAAKEKEIGQLVEELRRVQGSLNHVRDTSGVEVVRLEEQLASRAARIEALEGQLLAQGDYSEVKRELTILRSMEFSSQTGAEDDGQSKTLEQLLLEKNRALQNELTHVRTASEHIKEQLEASTLAGEEARKALSEQRALVGQLEEDLRSVKAFSSQFRGNAEGGEDASGRRVGPSEAEVLAGVVGEMEPALQSQDYRAPPGSDSLLPIVQSQRERFRVRAQELEAQSLVQQQQIQLLQGEMDKVRSDNVKLYEKIKFLQSYSGKTAMDDPTMTKYSSEYEERLNPFTNFSRSERQRKYQNLQPHEKVTLSLGRFIMSNRIARMFAFFYTLFLHLLVFVVLYKLAHTETANREYSVDCHRKFAEHMIKFHAPGERNHKV